MKIKEIIKEIESFAPPELALSFDNSGLNIGSAEDEVSAILTTLDVTAEVAEEAHQKGANLILTHHPLIFDPLKSITDDSAEGKLLIYLIQNKISVYSAHTNLDACMGGMNDTFSQKLEVKSAFPWPNDGEDKHLARVCEMNDQETLLSLAEKVKKTSESKQLRVLGNKNKNIKKAVVCTGSGSDLIFEAIKDGADVLITGEIKHHHALVALANDIGIIEISHYDSEKMAKDIFYNILTDKFGEIITVHKSKADTNPFFIM